MALCHADEEWVPDIEKDGARTTLLWGLERTVLDVRPRIGKDDVLRCPSTGLPV